MQFDYDEIEDFIYTLRNARIELAETFESIPDRKYHDHINTLFRTIHSLKAKAFYFDLDEISSVVEKSEDIMTFLLKNDCTIGDSIRLWFDMLQEQFGVWIEELEECENRDRLSFYTEELDQSPTVKVVGYDIDLITSHRVIILQKDADKRKILEKIMGFSFKLITSSQSVVEVEKILSISPEPKILITDIKFDDGTLIDLFKKQLLEKTNIIVLSKLSDDGIAKVKTIMKTDDVFDLNRVKMSDIKSVAIKTAMPKGENMVYVPMNSTKMTLDQLTKSIKSMPEVLTQIRAICFDEEASYAQVAEVVEQDAATTGKILKRINSPYYGIRNPITTVRQAAMMLGKKKLYAMIMNGMSQDMIPDVDLSMYDIAFRDVIYINRLRSKLIEYWCKELSINQSDTETLVTISLLMVLGTTLTAKALDYNLQYEKFKIMKEEDPIYIVEKKLLDYTSYDACARIFELWNFPDIFIKVSKKIPQHKLNDTTVLKQDYLFAFIITIVHRIFSIDGKVELNKEILKEVQDSGLNHHGLHLAYKKAFGDQKYSGHFSMFFEEEQADN